jgi:hypothetical protein
MPGSGRGRVGRSRDPQVERSAEPERMPLGMTGRDWPHTEHALNLWGRGVLRN